MPRWQVIAAPMDSAGAREGEERAPAALLSAGIERLSSTPPLQLDTALRTSERDAASGVIAAADLLRSTDRVRDGVAETFAQGRQPLLVGGDCAILPGALVAAREAFEELCLLYVDGHPDACDGSNSPTGEAADMTLSVLTTARVPGLVPAGAGVPVLPPERVALVGYRGDAPADVELADGSLVTEASLLPGGLPRIDAAELTARGGGNAAASVLAALAVEAKPLWVHFDVDVLDPREMPAVSYPQPGGPAIGDVVALLRAVVSQADVVGFSVACFNPDLDPDGTSLEAVCSAILTALTPPART